MLKKACDFAMDKHQGQLDDEGKAYFNHVLQVAITLMQVTKDPEIIAAGFLHDTIEDTKTTYEELVEQFSKRVADLVMEVTHEGEKNKGYYFPRLSTRDGILIKFADRLSNLSRMSAWNEERQLHYLKKSKFWDSVPRERLQEALMKAERRVKELEAKLARKRTKCPDPSAHYNFIDGHEMGQA